MQVSETIAEHNGLKLRACLGRDRVGRELGKRSSRKGGTSSPLHREENMATQSVLEPRRARAGQAWSNPLRP
jgi:hypothetical protein